MWLNEFIRWGIQVNKKGCPLCSKTNRDPPLDIINLISHKRYDFGVREKFIAKQIVDAVEGYNEHKSYVGFYGEEHTFEILKHICDHYSKQATEPKPPLELTEEEKFKGFLRFNELNITQKGDSSINKEENTNKFSMLMSLFQLNRAK